MVCEFPALGHGILTLLGVVFGAVMGCGGLAIAVFDRRDKWWERGLFALGGLAMCWGTVAVAEGRYESVVSVSSPAPHETIELAYAWPKASVSVPVAEVEALELLDRTVEYEPRGNRNRYLNLGVRSSEGTVYAFAEEPADAVRCAERLSAATGITVERTSRTEHRVDVDY